MKRYRSNYKSSLTRRIERKSKKRLFFTFLIILILLYSFFTWFFPTLIGNLTFINKLKEQPKKVIPVSENTTLAPPVFNIPFDATNSSAIIIRGYSAPEKQVEIYIDDNLSDTIKVNKDGSFISSKLYLNLGTSNIYGKTIDDQGVKSLPSKTIRILYSNEKPKLDVSEPSDNQTINGGDKKIKVSGKTDPDNTVTINGSRVIVNNDGNFSQTLEINEGDNNIVISSTNSTGNSTQIGRKVTYQP
ncbi:MAG: hypothetical protein Q7R97_05520 [Candidatus Daviesbacteria bacterium]|nr:hypothetical protein [Candidatus Daviesbacteria bacterium]